MTRSSVRWTTLARRRLLKASAVALSLSLGVSLSSCSDDIPANDIRLLAPIGELIADDEVAWNVETDTGPRRITVNEARALRAAALRASFSVLQVDPPCRAPSKCAHTRFSTGADGISDGGVGWSICSEHEVLWEMGGGPVLHVDSGLAEIVTSADAVRQGSR